MEQPPPVAEMPTQAPQMASVWSKLFNVFAAPADVFDAVKNSPFCPANWLTPAIIAVVIGWLGATLIFSQESVRHQLSEMSSQAIEKQIQKQNMPKDKADQMRAAAEKFGDIGQRVGAYLLPPVMAFSSPFIWGLILWLGAKVLKAGFPYMKGVEVVGIGNMVAVLDGIIRKLLILVTGNIFASLSPVLFISDFNPQNPAHVALAVLDLMTFWLLAVRSIGLARLTGASFAKSLAWVAGIWLAYTGFFKGVGFAMQAAFGR